MAPTVPLRRCLVLTRSAARAVNEGITVLRSVGRVEPRLVLSRRDRREARRTGRASYVRANVRERVTSSINALVILTRLVAQEEVGNRRGLVLEVVLTSLLRR